jgi:hypothetical protein
MNLPFLDYFDKTTHIFLDYWSGRHRENIRKEKEEIYKYYLFKNDSYYFKKNQAIFRLYGKNTPKIKN